MDVLLADQLIKYIFKGMMPDFQDFWIPKLPEELPCEHPSLMLITRLMNRFSKISKIKGRSISGPNNESCG